MLLRNIYLLVGLDRKDWASRRSMDFLDICAARMEPTKSATCGGEREKVRVQPTIQQRHAHSPLRFLVLPGVRCSRPSMAPPLSTPALSSSRDPRRGQSCTLRCCPPRSSDTSTPRSSRCCWPRLERPVCGIVAMRRFCSVQRRFSRARRTKG